MNPSPRHLLAGLKCVPAVREQNAAVDRDQQDGGAATETGQVEDVREMRDEQSIGAKLGKCKPEPFDPAPV